MQESVAKTILIIKNFILEARAERAALIASIIILLVSGSKISLYRLVISIKNKYSKLKSAEPEIRRLLENFPITSKTYAKVVFALFAVNSVELIIENIYAGREFPSIKFISWLIHKKRNLNFIFSSK